MASKLSLKSKGIERPESFEAVEAKKLTESEEEKISRSLIIRWYMAKKFEKLKALQNKIIEASYSEREEIKERIIKNTKEELSKHKDLTKEEVERRSKQLADEVINVAEGRADMSLVAKRYAVQEEEQKVFYKVVDGFVSRENQSETLQKIAKNPKFADFLNGIKAHDPATAKRIDMAIKEGDYEGLQKIVEKSTDGKINKSAMNRFMAIGVLGSAHVKEYTPVDTVNKAISFLDQYRHVGHGFALDKASQDIGIPFLLIARFASWTLRDFRQMDNIMQRNKHLIEQKDKKSIKDNERLVFIEHMHKARMKLEDKVKGDKDLQSNFEKALDKYLDSKEELGERDKQEIKQASRYEDLRLVQLFEYYYVKDEDRYRWLMKSASRVPTMIRFAKHVFGEQRYIKATMLRYTKRRLLDRSITNFRMNAKNWGMKDILRNMNDFENKITRSRGEALTKYEDLYREASNYKVDADEITAKRSYLDKELLDQDRMLQRYAILVKRATRIMSDKAKKVIEAGKSIQAAQKGAGKSFLTKKLHQLPHVSDQTLEAIGLDKAKKAGYTGADLINGYTRRLVDIKTMEDVTRARFSALADVVDTNVARPVGTAWQGRMDVAKGVSDRAKIRKKLQNIEDLAKPHKGRYIAKTFGLPAIIIGIQGYDLFTGKAKTNEVLWDMGEAAGGFVPFLGTALDIRGLIKGESLSGRKLNTKERWMYAGFAAIGAIADAAILIGGLGLGIRAGLGGVRAGRRAVKAGSALAGARKTGGLRDMAYASKLPFFQRQIAKAGSKFNKVRRADGAAEALYTRKAITHANKISKYNSGVKDTYKIEKFSDIEGKIKIAEKAGEMPTVRKLERLRKTLKKLGSIEGLDVLKDVGKGIDIPRGFFSRQWLKSKKAFLGIKQWLLSIGIPPKTIKNYEKSFSAVASAKQNKAKALDDLHDLIKAKEGTRLKAVDTYKEYMVKAEKHGQTAIDYTKVVDDISKQKRKHIRLGGIKRSKKEHLKHVEKLHKGKKATEAEVNAAKKALKEADEKIKASRKYSKKLIDRKKKLSKELKTKGDDAKGWKKEFDSANTSLSKIETDVVRHEDKLRAAEESIVSANTKRAMMSMEMENKATRMARYHDKTASVAKLLQYGGLAMGGIWLFSGFHAGPAEQLKTASKAVKGAAKMGGKTFDYVMLQDHSGRPPIDQMVEERVRKVKMREELNGYVEKATRRGVKPEEVLAKHWNTDEAKEIARRQGLYQKVQKLIADKKVTPETAQRARAKLRDVATGDSAGKAGEKLAG